MLHMLGRTLRLFYKSNNTMKVITGLKQGFWFSVILFLIVRSGLRSTLKDCPRKMLTKRDIQRYVVGNDTSDEQTEGNSIESQ